MFGTSRIGAITKSLNTVQKFNVQRFKSACGYLFKPFKQFNRSAPFKTLRSRERDRRRYLHWVFEAKKRFGLSVLNYTVTSNHTHLLVKEAGPEVIAQSRQLIAAGRTAQEYNQRKNRHGAFWEDRYHATAIEADEHLHRCLTLT